MAKSKQPPSLTALARSLDTRKRPVPLALRQRGEGRGEGLPAHLSREVAGREVTKSKISERLSQVPGAPGNRLAERLATKGPASNTTSAERARAAVSPQANRSTPNAARPRDAGKAQPERSAKVATRPGAPAHAAMKRDAAPATREASTKRAEIKRAAAPAQREASTKRAELSRAAAPSPRDASTKRAEINRDAAPSPRDASTKRAELNRDAASAPRDVSTKRELKRDAAPAQPAVATKRAETTRAAAPAQRGASSRPEATRDAAQAQRDASKQVAARVESRRDDGAPAGRAAPTPGVARPAPASQRSAPSTPTARPDVKPELSARRDAVPTRDTARSATSLSRPSALASLHRTPGPAPSKLPTVKPSAPPTGDTRRQYPRADIQVHTKLSLADDPSRYFEASLPTVNLSVGGMFLQSSFFLKIGTRLLISLQLPQRGRHVQVKGEVVRVETTATGDSGFAVRFTEYLDGSQVTLATHFLSPVLREFLAQYATEHRFEASAEYLTHTADVLAAWELKKAELGGNVWDLFSANA